MICKTCGDPLVRKEYGDEAWIHEGDEAIVGVSRNGKINLESNSKYNHEAVPDIIDVKGK